MTAYISISYSKRKLLEAELKAISVVLKKFSIEPFIFVDKYNFSLTEEKLMMQQAMADIDSCNFLIAEVSDKAIGIGVEAGYAKGKNKPLLYIRQNNAEHSTTIAGISDFQIIYGDLEDLKNQLEVVIKTYLLIT